MPYIRLLNTGKSQVIKDVAFCTLLEGQLPSAEKSFSSLFTAFDAEVKKIDKRITTGAMSNEQCAW